jgi:hypothetical protein
MFRSLRIAICCALTFAAFAATATTASALDFCVGDGTVCNQTFAYSESGLTDALNAYYASDSETDNIWIAPGTIEFVATLNGEDSPTNGELRIRGAGSGKTKLVFNDVLADGAHLDFNEDSEISGVSIEHAGAAVGARVGLTLHGGNAEDIYVFMTPGDNVAYRFGNGATRCLSCRAKVSGAAATAYYAEENSDAYVENGKAEVYDADPLVHTRGASVYGANASIELDGTLLKGFNRGIFQHLGQVRISDSVIDLGDQTDAIGAALDTASTIDDEFFLKFDGVTIVGTGDGQSGVKLRSNAGAASTGSIEVEVDNTLVWLPGVATNELTCEEAPTADLPVQFLVSYSLAADLNTPDCAITAGDMTTGTPTFVDFDGGDYRPAPGSPVIDAGDPSTAYRPFDFWGGVRFIDGGDLDGSGDIDIGAGEYQNYAPNKPEATASPTTVTVGSSVTFSATGSDPNNQPLTFSWEFGEGGSADGATTTRTYAVPGTYKAKAIASDGSLTRASAWVDVTVVAATPPPAPSIILGKPTAKFKYGKKKSKRFAVGTVTSKPRIPVTTNFAGEFTLTLAKIKGGWTSGKKCVSKKPKKGKPKRCNLALKGSQKLTLPAGESFLTFGGKWGRSALPTGKYMLTVSGGGAKHDVALNAVRNMKG